MAQVPAEEMTDSALLTLTSKPAAEKVIHLSTDDHFFEHLHTSRKSNT